MKNSKGYMLVEIIIAAVITMTIAYMLLDLTYNFKTKNEDTFNETIFLTEKTLMTKEVMNDVNNYRVEGVDFSCNNNTTPCFDIIFKKDETEIKKRLKISGNTYEYGSFNGTSFYGTDYYKKILNNKLTVGTIQIKNNCYNGDGETVNGIMVCPAEDGEKYEINALLEINIPLSNQYLKENFSVKLSIPYSTLKVDNNPQPTFDMIDLASGMVPVKYDGTTLVKADITNTNNDWFNYKEKQWANAVLVKTSNPANYSCLADETLDGGYCYSNAEITYNCSGFYAVNGVTLVGNECCQNHPTCFVANYFIQCSCPSGFSQSGPRCCRKANSSYSCPDGKTLDGTRCKRAAIQTSIGGNSRDYYMNASAGIEILESDVLAYYVWIPRYKYKLWNTTFTTSSPQEIDIVFETINDPISTGSTNGEYLSHPAFWWDNDSDGIREAGEELEGIWVGKFETSSDTTCTAANYSVGTGCDITTLSPRILPNITSWRGARVSTMFNATKKIESTTYLTTNGVNQIDSHMMKNMEWGAVAYLSHSKYGKNSEIAINNNSSYLTGGGAYKTSVAQSTTGNITGIYDMSGGTYEYVMGVLQDNTNTNTPMSGFDTTDNSGFTGKAYNVFTWTNISGTAFPAKKYYDLYAYGTTYNDQAAYNRSHLGDATGETRSWYSDSVLFVRVSDPWFLRGGYYLTGSNAGAFDFGIGTGTAGINGSWHSVITNIK